MCLPHSVTALGKPCVPAEWLFVLQCFVCQIVVAPSWTGGHLLMEETSLESLCCCWSTATEPLSASV